MKIITIIGARPQFIKSSVISHALKQHQGIEEIIIHTGQHFDHNMSAVFFEELELSTPKYNLDIHGLLHGAMTGQMLLSIEPILQQEKPDLVIVYGDTNSTLAGALAAKKMNIPIAHVEAGLRSYNLSMPEEINRILVDRMADLLFCPTQQAEENLTKEGFRHFDCKIFNFGDVMKDAALHFGKEGLIKSSIKKELGLTNFVLATMHRAENIDNEDNLGQMIKALNIINKSTQVLVPLHPRTKQTLNKMGLTCEFKIIEPMGYLDMLALIQQSDLVITDSGGLQKEAYFFNKFCITMRNETEWTELVTAGLNRLTNCDAEKIVAAYQELKIKSWPEKQLFYGNGDAAKLIASAIINYIPSLSSSSL